MYSHNPLENEVLSLTRELIHNHFTRNFKEVLANLAPNFFWIGPYNFQWAESSTQFETLTNMEYSRGHCVVNQEIYRLIAHDEMLWIVAGSLQAIGRDESGNIMTAKLRLSVIWSHMNDEWKVLHLHASRSNDRSGQNGNETDLELPSNEMFDKTPIILEKPLELSFNSTDRRVENIRPDELLRIQSDHQYCELFRLNGSHFRIRSSMESLLNQFGDQMVRVHRSHAVNLNHMLECKYKGILLRNGEQVPVAKDKVKSVRQRWLKMQLDNNMIL